MGNRYFQLILLAIFALIGLSGYLLFKSNFFTSQGVSVEIVNSDPAFTLSWEDRSKFVELMKEREIAQVLTANEHKQLSPVNKVKIVLTKDYQRKLITSAQINDKEKIDVVSASPERKGEELYLYLNVNKNALDQQTIKENINGYINNQLIDVVVLVSQPANKSVEELRMIDQGNAVNISDLNAIDIYNRYLKDGKSSFVKLEIN